MHSPSTSSPHPASLTSSTDARSPAGLPRGRLVTDAPTRLFHWLFALSFTGAYLSAESEHWRLVHVTLGYTLAGLLVFRLLYGVLGPRQLRLGVLWRKLAAGLAWGRVVWQGPGWSAVSWRPGQNLLMALAVAAMLALVLPLVLSGYALYNEWGGEWAGEWLEALHEFSANAFLAMVLGHLFLLLALSLWRRQNVALPMLTGRVAGSGTDLVTHRRRWLAWALALAVVAGWWWQALPW